MTTSSVEQASAAPSTGHGHDGPTEPEGAARLPTGRRGVWKGEQRWIAGGLLAGLAPYVALFVSQMVFLRYRSAPAADWAVISLHVRDAEHLHQLLGPYSRLLWHHPGPAYWYFLVPFFALSGQRYGGLAAGVAALNLLCALTILLLVRAAAVRTERRPALAVWAAATALVAFSAIFGLEFLRVPWTPFAVIMPITVAGVAGVAVWCDVRWALPVVAIAASFAVEMDVAAGPVVACLVVVTVAPALWRFRGELRRWVLAAVATVVLVAAMWALPVYEQLTRSPGNFTLLWRYFTEGKGGGHPPLVQAVRFAGIQTTLSTDSLGNWVNQKLPLFPPFDLWRQGVFGVALVLLLGCWVWGHRSGRPFVLGLGRTALLAVGGAVLTVWLVTGPLASYLTSPASGVGLLVLVAVAVGALSMLLAVAGTVARMRRARLAVGALAALAVLGGSTVMCVKAARLPAAAQETYDPGVAQLTAAVTGVLPPRGHRTVLFDICGWLPGGGVPPWSLAAAIANQLEIHGVTTTVNPAWTFMFGERRGATGHEDVHLVLVNEGQPNAGLTRPLPTSSRLLGSADGYSVYLVPPGVPLLGP